VWCVVCVVVWCVLWCVLWCVCVVCVVSGVRCVVCGDCGHVTHQRAPGGVQVSHSDLWNELGARHHEKVEVEEELELFKQHLQ